VTFAFEPHARREGFLRQAEFFTKGCDVHATKFAQSEHLDKSFVRTLRDDTKSLRSHNPNMARKPKVRPVEEYDRLREASGWYLAAYRDRANLSLEALADEMKTSRGQISDLENGAVNKRGIKTRYNRDWLEAACQALDVAAGDLLDTNPFREDPKFAALRRAYPGLSEKDLDAVKAVADTMAGRTATGG
jgi:transcriptional regulator with XRE-family HTH domain